MDKVTGQCPQTTTFFEKKGEPKQYRIEVAYAYQPNALLYCFKFIRGGGGRGAMGSGL